MIVGGGLLLLAASVPAEAKIEMVFASCGESTGMAFFFEGNIVGPGQGGWLKDGVTGGGVALVKMDGQLDILFKDTTGNRYSHRAGGSDVRLIAHSGNSYLVVAENREGKTAEHFLFKTNELGVGTLAWGTVRLDKPASKSSLMTAECGPNK